MLLCSIEGTTDSGCGVADIQIKRALSDGSIGTKAADMQSRVEEAPLSPELPPTAPEIQSER
jgi:hypothetical protein